jgi:Squalene-hopene cyclase C-terminal domain
MKLVSQSLRAAMQKPFQALKQATELRLYRPSHMRFWLRDLAGQTASRRLVKRSRLTYQRAMVDWIKNAQDLAIDGGVAAYYEFGSGWSAAYPETTGYIVATCLEAANRLGDSELKVRARRMADWELEIQLPEGAWQGGLVTAPRVPSVFNTGQIMQGMLAAYLAFAEDDYLDAALKAGRWLISQQDPDGAWRRYTYNNFPNTYSTRVAWPLAAVGQVAGESLLRKAAIRHLSWVNRCQHDNGWFDHCTLEVRESPLTHTLGYTIEGLIECGVLLKDEQWVAMGQRTADVLLRRFEIRGRLAGTYDENWRGDFSFACVTGCAQMSMVWGKLFELTKDARYLNAALKMNDYVLSLVDLESNCSGIRGGVKGSDPLWGPYMRFRMPSWAVKFTLDALFQEADGLSRLKEHSHECHASVRIPK